jgi:hypothetical protein
MKIIDKIRAWSEIQNFSADEADRLQRESTAAVLGGIGSPAWETFMRNFHSNDDQLQRLLGNDDFINTHDYGETILAYLAGDGTCGGGTKFSGVLDEMPGNWRVDLDADLKSATEPESNPVSLPEA